MPAGRGTVSVATPLVPVVARPNVAETLPTVSEKLTGSLGTGVPLDASVAVKVRLPAKTPEPETAESVVGC